MGTSIYSTIWFGTDSVQTGIALCFPFLLVYGLGLPSAFHSEYYTSLGLPFCFLSSTILVWDCLLYRVLYGFRLVLSQVRSVPQLYLRSFKVEGKP